MRAGGSSPLRSGVFVTGTDTGVGKTLVAVALLHALARRGLRAAGMKPVAAGVAPGVACNADVEALALADGLTLELRDRNPYAFAPAIAPHLAAVEAGQRMDLDVIAAAWRRLHTQAEIVVVEGAGGVLVPIDERHDMLDIAARLELPILLVVGMRLGCINHALLSAEVIRARGLKLAGWVANEIDPAMQRIDASADCIAERVGMPALAFLRWREQQGTVSAAMDKVAAALVSCLHGDRLR